jgi:DNA mismatch repair protein MutS
VADSDVLTRRISILCAAADDADRDAGDRPAHFGDLNLDRVIAAVTAGRQEYRLEAFFFAPLRTPDAVAYRHEVFRDLADELLRGAVETFAQSMRTVRRHERMVTELRYVRQQQAWFIDGVGLYCAAVTRFARDLARLEPRSRGFDAVRDHMVAYARSDRFTTLATETRRIRAALAEVEYCLFVRGGSVRVSRYESEPDYGAAVEATFAKFRQGTATADRGDVTEAPDMNHVEAQVLDQLARLFPQAFQDLTDFCTRNRSWLDETVARFDREVQFYLAYGEVVARLARAGLPFCYPEVGSSKDVRATDTFDIALALSLADENQPVVCNEFHLNEPERIIVVSGPNQGGKTTFARTFGQLHVLARLGCPVPGKMARLFLFDELHTHFERAEDITDLRGKLEDDLVRIHDILSRVTPRSIVILNEAFTSTALRDAVFLGRKVLERIARLDLLCVCVTFVDELASLGSSTVSMVSTVDPRDPAQRTYKVVRRRADGRVYAVAIAEKYGLTYELLKERIPS